MGDLDLIIKKCSVIQTLNYRSNLGLRALHIKRHLRNSKTILFSLMILTIATASL